MVLFHSLYDAYPSHGYWCSFLFFFIRITLHSYAQKQEKLSCEDLRKSFYDQQKVLKFLEDQRNFDELIN